MPSQSTSSLLNVVHNVINLTGDALAPKEEESTSSDPTYVEDTMYMYFPDRLPAQRQLHYQLCDIMDEQLQKVIHSNDGKEKECTVSTSLASYTSWRKT